MATNASIWSAFDEVFCLTLEGDIERQRHASAELCRVGLRGFKFLEGVAASSSEVIESFRRGDVHSFPPCFRCGKISCDDTDCNNTLIAPQVGCFLSFMKLFRIAQNSRSFTFLLFEDDVKFPEYVEDLTKAALTRDRLTELGLFGTEPCLIGFGRGKSVSEEWCFDGRFAFRPGGKFPQNPGFAFNRPFAELALSRFYKIAHTVDVYIHYQLSEFARHYSLEPPLSYELSTSTGELPSRIHPKAIAFENPLNSPEQRVAARDAFAQHIKHTLCVSTAVVGSPRCGMGYMAHAMRQYGLDIGHEIMGRDGISSWLFAVKDTDLPFGGCTYSRNSRYVYPMKTIGVICFAANAVPALILENTKNVQSYAFRRRWIKMTFDVDIDDFKTDFERALASYVFWYRIVLQRRPTMWVRLERAQDDLATIFRAGLLTQRQNPDQNELTKIVNSNKPYLSQMYTPDSLDFDDMLRKTDPALSKTYEHFQSELIDIFRCL